MNGRDREQFKQTVIGTASVGAVLGILPMLGSLAVRSEWAAGSDGPWAWMGHAVSLAGVLAGSVLFCVVVFGLLPMLLQAGFVKLGRMWTGQGATDQ